MTDHNDYTAKIRAKGLDSTGITEQIAAEMYRNKGRRYMGIVELVVDETHEKADGTRKVDLILSLVEPAIDDHMAEYLRELTRVTYRNRQQADGQLAIDDSLRDEPTVAQVLEGGQRFRPHPFLPDDAAKDTPICDVCGGIEASAVHSTQDVLPEPDNEAEPVAEEDEPHAFTPDDTFPENCRLCGRHENGDGDPTIHVADDDIELIEPEDDVDEDDHAVVLDHAPNPLELAKLKHAHHGGRCLKNSLGTRCDYDEDDSDPEFDAAITEAAEHLADVEQLEHRRIPNPFDTTPAGA